MNKLYPHYYGRFSCRASDCRESCCIGWEIDIDGDTLKKYMALDGALGDELRSSITRSEDGSDCFALSGNDRCPFLDEKGLCRLIIAGGEDMLCEICRMHPRFVNIIGDREEIGLGLCCEEAAELILSDDAPFSLICDNAVPPCPDEKGKALLSMREELLEIIENGADISSIAAEIMSACEKRDPSPFEPDPSHSPKLYLEDNKNIILSLEPLNDRWKAAAEKIGSFKGELSDYEEGCLKEYKNLLKYYIFRYFIKAYDDGEIFLKAALGVFAADAVSLISKACGMSITDSACLWSKETEYSEENTEAVYDALYERYLLKNTRIKKI